MVDRKVNIQISEEVWSYLNQEKQLGETFDDVLKRLLVLGDKHKNR